MKKDYSPPVFRYLDFLYPQEPALAQRTSGEDGLMRSEPPNRTLPRGLQPLWLFAEDSCAPSAAWPLSWL
jgi:hypothetical protein